MLQNPLEQHILEFIHTYKGVTLDNLMHQRFIEDKFYNTKIVGTPAECLDSLVAKRLIHRATFKVGDKDVAMLLPANATFTGYT